MILKRFKQLFTSNKVNAQKKTETVPMVLRNGFYLMYGRELYVEEYLELLNRYFKIK